MRRLKGGVPRGYPDHRRADARRYKAYVEALLAHYGELPRLALPTLREAGRLSVDLERIGRELEAALARRRRRDVARLRRQRFAMTEQLQRLERRLEELAAQQPRSTDRLAGLRLAAAKGGRS